MTGIGLHYPGMPCPLCDAKASDPDPCPGDCNRAWVAAEHIAHDEAKSKHPRLELVNHDVPMVEAAPVWCRECQDTIYDAIHDFPKLCSGLTPGTIKTRGDASPDRHFTSTVPPSPSPAWDQADEIIRWAVNTEDQLRAHIGDYTRGQRPWRDLGSAVAYLTLHSTALLCSPDAVAIGFQALRLHRRLTQVTGSDKLVHRLPGTCMLCKRRSLQRADGDDLVKCRACGATWDVEYYNFLARASADAVRAG